MRMFPERFSVHKFCRHPNLKKRDERAGNTTVYFFHLLLSTCSLTSVNFFIVQIEGWVLTTHELTHSMERFCLKTHSHGLEECFHSTNFFCTKVLCSDLDMSLHALPVDQIVILQF